MKCENVLHILKTLKNCCWLKRSWTKYPPVGHYVNPERDRRISRMYLRMSCVFRLIQCRWYSRRSVRVLLLTTRSSTQQQYYPRPNGYTISYSIKLIINSDPPSEDICPNYSRCLPTVLSEVLQGIVLCILLTRCEVEHNNESHNPKWITHIFFLLGPRWYWVFTMMIKIWWQDAYGSPQLQRTFCPRRTFCPPQERTSS